jgi:putative inorganic carbon (hco3(-)) transporter
MGTAVFVGLLAGLSPKLAVVAALGLAFVALVMSDLAIGLALFALVSFLEVLPASGAPTSFAKIAGLLLALSWLAAVTIRREDAEDTLFTAHPVASYLLLALIGWALLSVLWAESTSDAFESTYRLALNVALFPIVYTAVRSGRHAGWVLAAFMVGTAISAIYGVFAPQPPDTPTDVARLGGAGVDPNELAALLVAALAFAAAFAMAARRSPAARVLAASLVVLCVAGVLFTLSRGGLVALAVALVAAVIFGGRWRMPALALLVVIATGAIAYLTVIATPDQRAHVTEVRSGGSGREDIWTVGWRMVEAYPVTGVGAGNFPVASVHYLLKPGTIQRSEYIVDHPKVAHNTYLGILAELGIVGFGIFMSIIWFSLGCLLRAIRGFTQAGDTRMELLSRALLVALLGVLAADFFLSAQFSKQLWLLMALGPSMLAISQREAAAPEPREETGPVAEPALAPVA